MALGETEWQGHGGTGAKEEKQRFLISLAPIHSWTEKKKTQFATQASGSVEIPRKLNDKAAFVI